MSESVVTAKDIILSLMGSGGFLYFAFNKWSKWADTRQVAQAAAAAAAGELKKDRVHAELDNKKNFQEDITSKLIEQFLDQFNSYQVQNEKWQQFFFDSLDPLLAELKDNSENSRNTLRQIDLMQRGMREMTSAIASTTSANEGIIRILAGEHPIDTALQLPTAGEAKPRRKVKVTRIELSSEE